MNSNEINPSVWRFGPTGQAGPSVLILGGVHGNERTGIDVVERLATRLLDGTLVLRQGELVLALGNLEAIRKDARFLGGRDLNRMFTRGRLSAPPDGTPEDARARVLAELIASSDVTVDLHSTNKPSEPFVASLAGPERERLFRWLGADKVLADPSFVLAGEPATTDEFAEQQGRIGICYETGFAGDTSRVECVLDSIWNMLGELGMAPAPLAVSASAPDVFELRHAVVLDERPFRFVDPFGNHSFVSVRAGETVAWRGEEPVVAAEDGVLVFQKIPEHWEIGKPVAYFAVRAN